MNVSERALDFRSLGARAFLGRLACWLAMGACAVLSSAFGQELRAARLFDFGLADTVGWLEEFGRGEQFIGVDGTEDFTSERGWGIENGPLRRSDRHWIEDLLERDALRLNPGQAFLFEAEPGRYSLLMKTLAVGEIPSRLRMENVALEDGSAAEFELSKEEEPIRAHVQILGSPVRVHMVEGYADLRWMALIPDR